MNESTTPAYLIHLTTAQLRALLSDALAGAGDKPMTTQEAAKFLKISENTLRELAAAAPSQPAGSARNGALPARPSSPTARAKNR